MADIVLYGFNKPVVYTQGSEEGSEAVLEPDDVGSGPDEDFEDSNVFMSTESTTKVDSSKRKVSASASGLGTNPVEHGDIAQSEGLLRKTGTEAYEAIKTSLGEVTAPGVNDDSSAGYSKLSMWIDTTVPTLYICLDPSVGAANWVAV